MLDCKDLLAVPEAMGSMPCCMVLVDLPPSYLPPHEQQSGHGSASVQHACVTYANAPAARLLQGHPQSAPGAQAEAPATPRAGSTIGYTSGSRANSAPDVGVQPGDCREAALGCFLQGALPAEDLQVSMRGRTCACTTRAGCTTTKVATPHLNHSSNLHLSKP